MLLDGGENFEGFVIGPGLVEVHTITHLHSLWLSLCSVTWKSEVNVAAVTVLSKEVKSLNPTFQACDIRGMVYKQANKYGIII